jgi:hypothetical protein
MLCCICQLDGYLYLWYGISSICTSADDAGSIKQSRMHLRMLVGHTRSLAPVLACLTYK